MSQPLFLIRHGVEALANGEHRFHTQLLACVNKEPFSINRAVDLLTGEEKRPKLMELRAKMERGEVTNTLLAVMAEGYFTRQENGATVTIPVKSLTPLTKEMLEAEDEEE